MFKKIIKVIFFIGLSLIILYLGAEAGYQIRYKVEQRKSFKAAESFNQAIVDMFLEDTYGGTTPEETFNLLVDALEKENIDLAIKYFVLDPERRKHYWNKFKELKEKGGLDEYVKDLPKWKKFEEDIDYWGLPNEKKFTYHTYLRQQVKAYDPLIEKEIVLPAGSYAHDVTMAKNINGLWKISLF